MRAVNAVVRDVLAHRLARPAQAIRAWNRLICDFDLKPLELVLVALDVEDIERIELPIGELAAMETVGDLFAFISGAVAHDRVSSDTQAATALRPVDRAWRQVQT